MIILDTNVLSELIRPWPEPKVVEWLRGQTRSLLFTTAVSRGEMMYGVMMMPDGHRKTRLQQQVMAIFAADMNGKVLPYDSDAADARAVTAATRRAQGRLVKQSDMMIAGIVRSRKATLATRNVRDFEGCGIALLDPWH